MTAIELLASLLDDFDNWEDDIVLGQWATEHIAEIRTLVGDWQRDAWKRTPEESPS